MVLFQETYSLRRTNTTASFPLRISSIHEKKLHRDSNDKDDKQLKMGSPLKVWFGATGTLNEQSMRNK